MAADADADADVQGLNRAHGIEDNVIFENRYGGPVAVLGHGASRAVVAVQGAQVLSYCAAGFGDLLWLSPQAKLGTGRAVRGGIPICWPWFGPHPEGGNRPAHGFVRARPWRVARTEAGPDGTRIRLQLGPAGMATADWPIAASVQIDICLAAALTLELTTRNLSDEALSVTQALHTYFAVSDIATVQIAGLESVPFIDQLDPGLLKREETPIKFSAELDRIYQGQTGRVMLEDPGAGRRISIGKSGSASSVVWNPWIEKSARLGDMGDDGYRRMVCIETANAGADIVTIEPGGTHTLRADYAAERLT